MVLLNAALNATLPPAWASLAYFTAPRTGYLPRRLLLAGHWAAMGLGCTVGAAMFARWPGIVAASVNLAIGLCLLGREGVRKVRSKAPNGSPA